MKSTLFFITIGFFLYLFADSRDQNTDVNEIITIRNIYMNVEDYCGSKVHSIIDHNTAELTHRGSRTYVKFSGRDINFVSRFKGKTIDCDQF